MKTFTFKGLMVPVFTAFNDDNDLTVNYDIIDSYARFIKSNGVHAVLVNGTTGEGMSMSVQERKRTAEIWTQACKQHDLVMMIQVGGAPYPDVVELTKHAEKLDVDGILCLPELYFKPKSSDALTEYLRNVASYCPTKPFFYYHIPMFTDVNIHMPSFLDMAEKCIPNLCGIKYTSGELDQGSNCLKTGRTIFLGADTILCGAVAAGFDSFIMTTLNICPEISQKILNSFEGGRIVESRDAQRDLNTRISEILKHGDWVTAMKKAFNESCHLNLGKTRPPLYFKLN